MRLYVGRENCTLRNLESFLLYIRCTLRIYTHARAHAKEEKRSKIYYNMISWIQFIVVHEIYFYAYASIDVSNFYVIYFYQ